MNFRPLTLFACLSLSPLLPAAETAPQPTAAEMAKWPDLLMGRWKATEVGDTRIIDQIDHYHEDGRVEVMAEIHVEGEPKRILFMEAKWQLAGDKISYEATKSSLPDMMVVGAKWTETITAVTGEEFRYRNRDGRERIEKRLPDRGYAQSHVTLSQPDEVLKKRVKEVAAFAGYIKKLQEVCERQLKDETSPANLDLVVLVRPDGQAKTWIASKPAALREAKGATLRNELDAISPLNVQEGPVAFAIAGTVAGGVPHAEPPGFPTPQEWLDLVKEKEALPIPDGFADLVLPPKP